MKDEGVWAKKAVESATAAHAAADRLRRINEREAFVQRYVLARARGGSTRPSADAEFAAQVWMTYLAPLEEH